MQQQGITFQQSPNRIRPQNNLPSGEAFRSELEKSLP